MKNSWAISKREGYDQYLVVTPTHIKTQQTTDLTCEWLDPNHLTIHFNSKDTRLHVVYDLDDSLDVLYNLNEGAHVELLEVKVGQTKSGLQTQTNLSNKASLKKVSLNFSEHIMLSDVYTSREQSNLEVAYVDLVQGQLDVAVRVDLVGERAEALIKHAVLASNQDKKEYSVMLNHLAPNTTGNMLNYGVVQDEGKLTFLGIGRIAKKMVQSKTHQTSKIMVFDPKSQAKANPYLYIEENDVEASHAAGLGKMDPDHLYYLQSRGLSENEAKKLITHGYLEPVIEGISDEELKQEIHSMLAFQLGE